MPNSAGPNTSRLFYQRNYDVEALWELRPGSRIQPLGSKANQRCRFCGNTSPDVSFRKIAHAVPESLGNKTLTTYYECDTCNGTFGTGIENDLGNWSKPIRTLAQIRGKSGVPTLKSEKDGWRIEYDQSLLNVTAYEDNPPVEVDLASKEAVFTLTRDAYTPVSVLKAFMKIDLTLLPEEEIPHFAHLMAWVRSADYTRTFADAVPLFYTFQPGPMPNDIVKVAMLRRKPEVVDQPYRHLVIAYGNETLQVHLPSQTFDEHLNGTSWTSYHYHFPDHPEPSLYGSPKMGTLNLSGKQVVRNDVVRLTLHFEVGVGKDLRAMDR